MRVLVTGSRDWSSPKTVWDTLDELAEAHGPEKGVIVEGAASGADHYGFLWAQVNGWQSERHPADWEAHGKAAGFIRNQQMVDLGADLCVAFIRNRSKGATMTADTAEAAGIPTLRIEVND